MNISDSNPNEKPRGLCVNVMKHAYSMNIKRISSDVVSQKLTKYHQNRASLFTESHLRFRLYISLNDEVLTFHKVK